MSELDSRVRAWTDRLRSRRAFREEDIVELETHLREEVERLGATGLSEEEAFLVAERRIGDPDKLAREYAKSGGGEPWRGLPFDELTDGDRRSLAREVGLVALLALGAYALSRVPELFGLLPMGPDASPAYFQNFALFFMPLVALYYGLRSRPPLGVTIAAVALFALGGVVINLYPWAPMPSGETMLLAILHLPVMLWLAVGLVFVAGKWRESGARMDFLRTTGEAVIYYGLIALGGGALTVFTLAIFGALGLRIEQLYFQNVVYGGAVAAPIVAVFLVNAKKSIVENIAPVLSRIFTPLVLATLAAYLVALVVLRRSPLTDRDTLLAFNVMLILVLALVIYNLSARSRERERRGLMDWLNLALVACAIAIDVVALAAIAGRIGTLGWTANRAALLGENVVLLADLGGLAVLTAMFLAGTVRHQAIERWQTAYLPVILGWCALVVAVLPLVFRFA